MATVLRLTLTLALFLSMTFFHLHPTKAFLLENKVGHLKVGAFHVRHFGQRFIETKKTSVAILVKILARYDIVLVQGIRDTQGTALKYLKDQLNSKTIESWDYIASGQLGRSQAYLEQYAFFYKKSSATFVTSYQINDTASDVYAREPFCVEFVYTSISTTHSDLPMHRESVVFLALHAPTSNVRQELEELPTTIKSVASIYPRVSGFIAMGDMSADCRYLAQKWRTSLEIFNGKDFKSLIPDTADTTVKESSDCAYDRVILHGKELDAGDAKVFDFRSWLDLDEAETLAVSDHFPVEFVLY